MDIVGHGSIPAPRVGVPREVLVRLYRHRATSRRVAESGAMGKSWPSQARRGWEQHQSAVAPVRPDGQRQRSVRLPPRPATHNSISIAVDLADFATSTAGSTYRAAKCSSNI